MSQFGLFEPPPPLAPDAAPDPRPPVERSAQVRKYPSPEKDPCGHLRDCPGCRDCDRLQREGFRRCKSCEINWQHLGTMYEAGAGLLCTPCAFKAGIPIDNRADRVVWPRPFCTAPGRR